MILEVLLALFFIAQIVYIVVSSRASTHRIIRTLEPTSDERNWLHQVDEIDSVDENQEGVPEDIPSEVRELYFEMVEKIYALEELDQTPDIPIRNNLVNVDQHKDDPTIVEDIDNSKFVEIENKRNVIDDPIDEAIISHEISGSIEQLMNEVLEAIELHKSKEPVKSQQVTGSIGQLMNEVLEAKELQKSSESVKSQQVTGSIGQLVNEVLEATTELQKSSESVKSQQTDELIDQLVNEVLEATELQKSAEFVKCQQATGSIDQLKKEVLKVAELRKYTTLRRASAPPRIKMSFGTEESLYNTQSCIYKMIHSDNETTNARRSSEDSSVLENSEDRVDNSETEMKIVIDCLRDIIKIVSTVECRDHMEIDYALLKLILTNNDDEQESLPHDLNKSQVLKKPRGSFWKNKKWTGKSNQRKSIADQMMVKMVGLKNDFKAKMVSRKRRKTE